MGHNNRCVIRLKSRLGVDAYLFLEKSNHDWKGLSQSLQYANILTNPIERITDYMEDLQEASATIKRIDELMCIQNRQGAGQGAYLPRHAFCGTAISINTLLR